MFGSAGGPYVNNVLASMTDKIVCATFSADPNVVTEDEDESTPQPCESPAQKLLHSKSSKARHSTSSTISLDYHTECSAARLSPVAETTPAATLSLAAAPLLSFNADGLVVLRNCSAPNSRRPSYHQESLSLAGSALSFAANCAALKKPFNFQSQVLEEGDYCLETGIGANDVVCTPLVAGQGTAVSNADPAELSMSNRHPTHHHVPSRDEEPVPCVADVSARKRWSYPLSPQVVQKSALRPPSAACPTAMGDCARGRPAPTGNEPVVVVEVDCTVRSAQMTTVVAERSKSRSRINTDDRERFTEEVTV